MLNIGEEMKKNVRICAGIVLYNPEISRLKENIDAIINQVEKIILVDNGSNEINEIERIWDSNKKVVIIKNFENEGIAKALNQMCQWAKDNGFDWILTLDQDSVCDKTVIEEFLPYTIKKDIGIICPRINYENMKNKKESGLEFDYVEACMTSASLTSIRAWEKCKGFDEWMFIDYVDNDFGMRLKLNNYKIIRVNKAVLQHRLGKAEEKKIFGFKITVFNHSSFRNYYYVRNSIYFIRKYKENINILKYITILLCWESKKIIFEPQKRDVLLSMMKGIHKGLIAKIK